MAKLDPNLSMCEKHTYTIPDDDPRWEQIFARAPQINTRYHGPLPPGDVADLVVMFSLRTMTDVGYDEVIYFANKDQLARWTQLSNSAKGARWELFHGWNKKTALFDYERKCMENQSWGVKELLDYAEGLSNGRDKP